MTAALDAFVCVGVSVSLHFPEAGRVGQRADEIRASASLGAQGPRPLGHVVPSFSVCFCKARAWRGPQCIVTE